jgi:thiamine biosynthesis lipoprotein
MKKQAIIMGMPVTIQVVDHQITDEDVQEVFAYFNYIDKKFSTYKTNSEVSQINKGELKIQNSSTEMQKVLKLCEETEKETQGYFDINLNGFLDPSGIVKGYAIWQGAQILRKKGYENFYVEIAGDIQTFGKNEKGEDWRVGIQNPFNLKEIIKVLKISDIGVATSGNYERGKHILNPKTKLPADEIASITVIGPNIYEADRFATAAFAMGEKGIGFIERQKELEGYMIKKDRIAVMTSGFKKYLI